MVWCGEMPGVVLCVNQPTHVCQPSSQATVKKRPDMMGVNSIGLRRRSKLVDLKTVFASRPFGLSRA